MVGPFEYDGAHGGVCHCSLSVVLGAREVSLREGKDFSRRLGMGGGRGLV